MKDLLTIELKFSEYHTIFPKIMLTILMFLAVLMLLLNIAKRIKEGTLTAFRYQFFIDNYDRLKFYGTIVLLIAYALVLERIGFLPASILFMFLITLLFIGNVRKQSIVVSLANSLATSFVIWYLFGQLFDITLP
ncbi:tripartite tricarboxylate transporter TctB family protein [Pseudalkalibacillus salsuginis]|uniref:tripartite tricarboxylate transporter TctB family protein n=1 Tax=Pseudalkalibacillus salsuginis TaxID=2910972 RepID=UPI001F3F90CD|nr:tripartite tricarboxylate transporter TctB family protein [Pseudalkalibacillus salsuginis]MCF6409580.1 tripartite tricarboxylate transporter TctB family protein [Pseudalkalibacillus salsuginis]